MEQKRTVWIALATGIFLLVVFGGLGIALSQNKKNPSRKDENINGTFLWSPSLSEKKKEELPSDSEKPELSYSSETEKNENSFIQGTYEPSSSLPAEKTDETLSLPSYTNATIHAENLTVYANGNTSFNSLPSETSQKENTKSSESSASNSDQALVINFNVLEKDSESAIRPANKKAEEEMKESAAVKKVYENEEKTSLPSKQNDSKKSEESKKTVSKPVQKNTASKNTVSLKPVETKKETASSKTSVKSNAKIADRFWVQAASFSEKKKADEARLILDENKIQCEVFTYTDVKGNLFYRVRVGPYTTKSEAEYWKTRLETIPEFKSSGCYVTNSSATKK